MQLFSKSFEKGRVDQKNIMRHDVNIKTEMLLDFKIPEGRITESGLRNNISVGIQYISAWLGGNGAVAIFNLIARSQVWQWCNHPQGILYDDRDITIDMIKKMIPEEISKIKVSQGTNFNEKLIDKKPFGSICGTVVLN